MKKKRYFSLVALVLLCAMLLPCMASCKQEADYSQSEVAVYTIYSIKDESTTDEAILQTELALNRVLFYRLGMCVKLCLYTEDEYEDAIKAKIAEIEKYNEEKKNNKKYKDKTSSNAPSDDVSGDVYTGDKLLEDLDHGIEIELKKPRLDIFLVRGYDNYLSYIEDGVLTALDEKLAGDAKLINNYIHPSFLGAAKVNSKTYGVPCNTAIGEYEYIVFDKELLEKYEFDVKTMGNLEDLQEYLAAVQEGEEDVIPLLNASESNKHDFMFEDGYATMLDSTGHVMSTYEDEDLMQYYAMIARYKASGYFASKNGLTAENEDARFAVSFIKGNENTLAELSKKTGREYEYNIYRMPKATNANTIDNIFGISKYCVSNELTDASKLLKAMLTDPDVQNILTYGVENTNYILTDNNQVQYINDTYRVNRNYMGNPFIAYTIDGEPLDMWEVAKNQNLDSEKSNTLGFSLTQEKFTYKDEDGKEVEVFEPDYNTILKDVISKYYPKLLSGTAVDFDIAAVTEAATAQIYDNIRNDLKTEYESRNQAALKAEILAAFENTAEAAALYKEASDSTMVSVKNAAKRSMRTALLKELRAKYEKEGVDKTTTEITAEVDEMLTDAYIEEHLNEYYTEEAIQEYIDSAYDASVTAVVDERIAEHVASASYQAQINAYVSSSEFNEMVEDRFSKSGLEELNNEIDKALSADIKTVSDTIIAELNSEIESAVTAFVEDNATLLDKSNDELLAAIGYYKAEAEVDENGKEVENGKITYSEAYESYFQFVWEGKIKTQYYKVFGDPDKPNG